HPDSELPSDDLASPSLSLDGSSSEPTCEKYGMSSIDFRTRRQVFRYSATLLSNFSWPISLYSPYISSYTHAAAMISARFSRDPPQRVGGRSCRRPRMRS